MEARVIRGLVVGDLTTQYHHVLPRDQAAVVDEVVKLLSTPVPAISLESAQEALGRGMSEVTRIVNMLADHPEWFKQAADQLVEEEPGSTPGSKEQSRKSSEGAQNKGRK